MPGDVDGAGVDHRGGVLSAESIAFQQLDLAAPAFFGRGADHRQCQTEVVDDGRQCERRPDSDGGDQVVAARVPEAGQSVVFGTQRDVQVATADLRGERGVEAAVPLGDVKPVVRQLTGDPLCGAHLFPCGFRVVVQVAGQLDQLRVGGGDTRGCHGVDGRHWSPGTP